MVYFSDKVEFHSIHRSLRDSLISAPVTEIGEWQSQTGDPATSRVLELEDVTFSMDIPPTPERLSGLVRPSLPWAEDHFGERISGTPFNPPPSASWWPFRKKDYEGHTNEMGEFSHTYPERYWPVVDISDPAAAHIRKGIRFDYGDLGDIVDLIATRRNTRQAYLPVWFPEDLCAAVNAHRVPCSLGYHFMVRNGIMKIVYYIRSCDFLRHFRDDVYLTARLCQWVCDEVNSRNFGDVAVPGKLVMHISSLHVFEVDRQILAYQKQKDRNA